MFLCSNVTNRCYTRDTPTNWILSLFLSHMWHRINIFFVYLIHFCFYFDFILLPFFFDQMAKKIADEKLVLSGFKMQNLYFIVSVQKKRHMEFAVCDFLRVKKLIAFWLQICIRKWRWTINSVIGVLLLRTDDINGFRVEITTYDDMFVKNAKRYLTIAFFSHSNTCNSKDEFVIVSYIGNEGISRVNILNLDWPMAPRLISNQLGITIITIIAIGLYQLVYIIVISNYKKI